MFFKLLYEGIVQSLGQLTANKLRTFLSLLGITIGIFCIIAVLSAVDSLEDNIKGSFELKDNLGNINQTFEFPNEGLDVPYSNCQ